VSTDVSFSFGGDGSTISVDTDLDNIRVKELPRLELAITEYPKLEAEAALSIKELPRIEAEASLAIKELPRIEGDASLSIKELPRIELDANSKVDANLNIAIKELPDTRVHLPAHYQMGFSLFGYEIWKLSLCGETQMINEKYVPRAAELSCE
jgi:hypothetical protein